MRVLGTKIGPRPFLDEKTRDVIEVGDTTGTGNTILRIGRTIPEDAAHEWNQVALVVLTPDETNVLILELLKIRDVGDWIK